MLLTLLPHFPHPLTQRAVPASLCLFISLSVFVSPSPRHAGPPVQQQRRQREASPPRSARRPVVRRKAVIDDEDEDE